MRANPDGSIVRLKDVARIELGAQTYNIVGRFNGKPCGHSRHLSTARHPTPSTAAKACDKRDGAS